MSLTPERYQQLVSQIRQELAGLEENRKQLESDLLAASQGSDAALLQQLQSLHRKLSVDIGHKNTELISVLSQRQLSLF